MTLHIYNTLTRRKEKFHPIEPGKIGIYVCGITVYDYCHIGHARVLVAFDLITRYLRDQGWQVTYVRNITDVDDKIIERARKNGEPFNALTSRMIDAMHEDERALGVMPPDIEPRATTSMDDILDMVQTLVDNHYAYVTPSGDVYYRVRRFADYGKLTNKNPDELLVGVRVDVDEEKEDPRDFALWKAAPDAEVAWPSPWGKGRPGWHIECSAMSTSCLGETFDIHGGGPDLPFPHHENEIAQSEAATGKKYVNYWMHAGAVRVDNEKMSKSLGNFFTIREVLQKYHPEVVRFFLLSSHYRSPINYSEENLVEARNGLERFYTALRAYAEVPALHREKLALTDWYKRFVEAMDDDFNSREALAVMYDLVRELNAVVKTDQSGGAELAGALKGLGEIMGLLQRNPNEYFKWAPTQTAPAAGHPSITDQDVTVLSEAKIEELIVERTEAKLAKNYARADEIRNYLQAQGILLEDSRAGTQWRRS